MPSGLDNKELSLPIIAGHTHSDEHAIESIWQYCVQENHLPTGREEFIKFLALLFVSGGAVLYGSLSAKATQDYPEWQKQSFIICGTLCGAVVLISSTNEYLLRRDARRIPSSLRHLSASTSRRREILEDIGVITVSGVASLSLATTALRYPDFGNKGLQVIWFIFIEAVNTALHLLPVELVAFSHPIYSLPLKFLKSMYSYCIEPYFVSADEIEAHKFAKFKRDLADKLCQKINANLDASAQKIISGSFEWKGFSKKVREWFCYIKKENSPINQASSMQLVDIFDKKSDVAPPAIQQSTWKSSLRETVIYSTGTTLVLLSCIGYIVDPPISLQESGWSKAAAWVICAPAIYFFGVLMAHLGGVSAQADAASLIRTLQGKGSAPLAALLHTKSFALSVVINFYTAIFAYKAAQQVVEDHFSGYASESFFLECAKYGIIYLSLGAMRSAYDYYLAQCVRLNSHDENQLVAEFQAKIELFKRRLLTVTPDQLVKSLNKYSEAERRLLLGMDETEFQHATDFNARYKEHKQKQYQHKNSSRMAFRDQTHTGVQQSPMQAHA